MEICNWLIIIAGALYLHKTDPLIVTEYDTETIITYLKHVREFRSNETMESFFEINTTTYCRHLRYSYTYRSVTLPLHRQPERERNLPRKTVHIPYEHRNRMEQILDGVRIRRFRVGSLNQTLNFHSFQCLNREGEPLWFITPAFIPDSAFLFEVEPRLRNLVTREIDGKQEIPARLTAIIDKRITESRILMNHHLRTTSIKGREQICNLNRILQFRLCVIAAPRWLHKIGSSNIYFQRDGCGVSVRGRSDDIPRSLFAQKMTQCSVLISGFGMVSFHLGLIDENPPRLLCIQEDLINATLWYSRTIAAFKVPLLKHIEKYQSVLKNTDI